MSNQVAHRYRTHNHTIDPKTGFLESKSFLNAFDGERKLQFLKLYKKNCLRLYRTCEEMGLGHSLVNIHLRRDPAFLAAYEQVEKEYIDELEGVSRKNALLPRMMHERIFLLKSYLPNKYGDAKFSPPTVIQLNIDSKSFAAARQEKEAIEAEIVKAKETACFASTLKKAEEVQKNAYVA